MLVILATDGSEAADAGVELVARASWPPGTTVRLLYAIEPQPMTLDGAFGLSARTHRQLGDDGQAGAATLERAAARLAAADVAVERATARGRAATVIVDAAREASADLVVLGSRGHGTIATMVLGSVSAEVVDHSPVPVLVARGDRLDRVVLAWDGSEFAERAAQLMRWPIFARSSVSVVSVAQAEIPWWAGFSAPGAPSVIPLYAESAAASRREHERLATTMASELKVAGLGAEAEIRAGDAAEEIIAAAREAQADIVVLGTHGRAGIPRLVLGSVARNVLQHAPCSVLVSR